MVIQDNNNKMLKSKAVNTGEIIGCVFVMIVFAAFFFGGIEAHTRTREVFEILNGWEVKREDKTVLNVSLEDMSGVFNDVKRADKFIISHPLNINSHDPLVLRIYSRLSAVRVTVDDKQIYSYGSEAIEQQKMVGSGYHFVLLPSSYYGKKLTIELTASEDDAIKSAPEISITPADGAISLYSYDRMFGIFSGLFMFIVGIFLIILSVTAVYIDRRFYPLAIIGIFTCAGGIWCLATIKALQLFSGDVTLNSILEYLSMYLLPVPTLFLSRHFRQSASPGVRKFIGFMTLISAVFFLSAFFLQISGIMDVTRLTPIFHYLLIPVCITLIFAGGSKWRRMKASEKLFQIGIIFIVIMGILELAVFYVINYIYSLSNQINSLITPFAMLSLSVIMTLGFIMEIYDMRLKDTERKRLQKLAYRDQMTDLMNRGMCDKRFGELNKSDGGFRMLVMDLNGLKTVNDRHGHLMGDRYITLFSGIIIKALGGDRDLYRVGGDEFLYIDTEASEEDLNKKIDFIKKLEKIIGREEGIPFDIDASFGTAWSGETKNGDPEEVYRLADQRMYEMKKTLQRERM